MKINNQSPIKIPNVKASKSMGVKDLHYSNLTLPVDTADEFVLSKRIDDINRQEIEKAAPFIAADNNSNKESSIKDLDPRPGVVSAFIKKDKEDSAVLVEYNQNTKKPIKYSEKTINNDKIETEVLWDKDGYISDLSEERNYSKFLGLCEKYEKVEIKRVKNAYFYNQNSI